MTIGEFVTINSFIMLIVGPLIGFGGLISIVQKVWHPRSYYGLLTSTNRVN